MDLAIVMVWQCWRCCFVEYIFMIGTLLLQVMEKIQTLIHLLVWTLNKIGKRKRVWKCVRREGFQCWLLILCPLPWRKRCWALVFSFSSNFFKDCWIPIVQTFLGQLNNTRVITGASCLSRTCLAKRMSKLQVALDSFGQVEQGKLSSLQSQTFS